jgi:hypothetical protein
MKKFQKLKSCFFEKKNRKWACFFCQNYDKNTVIEYRRRGMNSKQVKGRPLVAELFRVLTVVLAGTSGGALQRRL